jgi:hypothetical protein
VPIKFEFDDASVSRAVRALVEAFSEDLNISRFSPRSVTVTVHSDPGKLRTAKQLEIADNGGNGAFDDGKVIFINPTADYTGTSLAKSVKQ